MAKDRDVVNVNDLIDAHGVAELVGLSHSNSVSGYLRKYPDFPRPVIDRGVGQARLWRRAEIEAWAKATGRKPKGAAD
jgi:predicted DNA-binding transcriptional regulator AlpA